MCKAHICPKCGKDRWKTIRKPRIYKCRRCGHLQVRMFDNYSAYMQEREKERVRKIVRYYRAIIREGKQPKEALMIIVAKYDITPRMYYHYQEFVDAENFYGQ